MEHSASLEGNGKSTILVLDDERLIRMTLSAKLKRIGFEAVAVATVKDAVALLQRGGAQQFRAIISDIIMDEMDGFVFRDIVRGLDPSMPMFFMTALDPEEGGGFLKRILEDPNSYYLPKAAKAEVLLRRVQSIVAARRVERFIERQMEETRQTMALAAQVQRSMLPVRALMGKVGFYTTWWQPKEAVSGDLYEAVPFGEQCYLYVLGDVQGHGVSAALAMTAVQSQLRQLTHREGSPRLAPHEVANLLQRFFRENLADVSYMTALICIHRPLAGRVDWISCGAPDLAVLDFENPSAGPINPEGRGGVPIGLMPDTVYTARDEVHTPLTKTAVCVAHTDGVLDISRDPEGLERMGDEERMEIRDGLILDARRDGSIVTAPYKFMAACEALGYSNFADDVTEVIFGARYRPEGTFDAAVAINAEAIDQTAREIEEWGARQGWDVGMTTRVELVFEEKLMNLFEHGFDYRQRLRESACVRIRNKRGEVELTVWDCGTQDPSMSVAAGSTDVAFDLANQRFSDGGRGRLMVRDMCHGIARNRYGILNETIYHIPFGDNEKENQEA
jgi:serine phosphatase RsbU (regulator of sigma subunit)/anti-sigma regulatory factor (Ser/Thr protein kinase)